MIDQSFHNIKLTLENRVARVDNDKALEEFLFEKKGNPTLLAQYIKEQYRENLQKELDISTRSLAVEILAHYYVQKLFQTKDRLTGSAIHRRLLPKLTDKILRHTDVIDCGERAIDNNRIIWDLLSFTLPHRK